MAVRIMPAAVAKVTLVWADALAESVSGQIPRKPTTYLSDKIEPDEFPTVLFTGANIESSCSTTWGGSIADRAAHTTT